MIDALDWFGRRCLAWPAMVLATSLTGISGYLLRFAAWITDIDIETLGDE